MVALSPEEWGRRHGGECAGFLRRRSRARALLAAIAGAGVAAAAIADPPPSSLVRPPQTSAGDQLKPAGPKPAKPQAGLGDEQTLSGVVTGIDLRVQPKDHPALPSVQEIGAVLVPVAQREGVWQPAPAGAAPVALDSIRGPISAAGANACSRAVFELFRARHIDGVVTRIVLPEPGKDGPMIVAVVVGTVSGVRVRSFEADGSEKVGDPRHDRIVANSPVQPTQDGAAGELLRQELLEDYLSQLNRLPGRMVSSDIAPGDQPGTVLLEYMLRDRKTFMVELQGSNTATEQNGRWMEQLGIVGTRLLDLDDVLDLRAATNTFNGIYSVSGGWEGRFGSTNTLRWRFEGDWSEYNASDVGIVGNNFTGTTWGLAGSMAWNFLQLRELFVDLEGGVRGWYSSVDQALGTTGSSAFATPFVRVNAYRQTGASALSANVTLDWTGSNGSTADLTTLGRTDPSGSWFNFHGDVMYTAFLDALLDPAGGSAVHQLTARGSWQWTPGGSRPTPVAQNVIGGYYTVRGYPQAVAVGDNTLVASLQYDFHLLRVLPETEASEIFGKPFRWTTEKGTGAAPSWDLSPHVFLDAGWSDVNAPTAGEPGSATLVALGGGVTVLVGSDFSVTLDVGVALNDQPTLGVDAGDAQVWFIGSLAF